MKICSKCSVEKDLDSFCNDKNRKDGKYPQCKDCKNEGERATSKERNQKRYYENREEILAYRKRHYAENKNYYYQRQYGISLGEYDAMLESQDYKCRICAKTEEENGKALAIDHDHKCCSGRKSCGKCVRGLLCNSCNWIIGAMNDDPANFDKAKRYILDFRKS